MEKSKREKSDAPAIWPFWLTVAVIVVAVVAFPLVYDMYGISDRGNRGLAGDSYGPLNALFSGLAFAGVLFAIYLQRKELQMQREDLELTRKELRNQVDAQNRAADMAQKAAAISAYAALLNQGNAEKDKASKQYSTLARVVFGGGRDRDRPEQRLRQLLGELDPAAFGHKDASPDEPEWG